MDSIKVFAPASVANVSCGYDILGLALEGVGDEVVLTKRKDKNIVITHITGADLPYEVDKNIVGVCLQAFLAKAGIHQGFDIALHKNVLPGSGLGSSASSSAAIVFAANKLLDEPFDNRTLVELAMEGEKFVSGKKHADNVAPSIMGGITCINSYSPLNIFSIPYPKDLVVAIAHPQIEVKTLEAKKILKREIPIDDVTQQMGYVAGLVCGLITSNYELISRSMEDVIAEPIRSMLIPQYRAAKISAIENGALGFNISGSGPSVFALCRGVEKAKIVIEGLKEVYKKSDFDVHYIVSKISSSGVRVIS